MESEKKPWAEQGWFERIVISGKLCASLTAIGVFLLGAYTYVVLPIVQQEAISSSFKENVFQIPTRFETEFRPRIVGKDGGNGDDESATEIDPRDRKLAEEFQYDKLGRMSRYCSIEITNQSAKPLKEVEILFENEMLVEFEDSSGEKCLEFVKNRLEIGTIRVDETIVLKTWSGLVSIRGIRCVYDGGTHTVVDDVPPSFWTILSYVVVTLVAALGLMFMISATLEKIAKLVGVNKPSEPPTAQDTDCEEGGKIGVYENDKSDVASDG